MLILVGMMAVSARAAGPVGVGLMLFGPTGLSGAYRLNDAHAVDLALAWRTHPGSETYLHSTYLWRFPDYYRFEGKPMLFYAGVGGRLFTETREERKPDTGRTFVGVRTAAGTAYTLPDAPLEFFGEVAITLDLLPSTIASFSLAAGGRFYF